MNKSIIPDKFWKQLFENVTLGESKMYESGRVWKGFFLKEGNNLTMIVGYPKDDGEPTMWFADGSFLNPYADFFGVELPQVFESLRDYIEKKYGIVILHIL